MSRSILLDGDESELTPLTETDFEDSDDSDFEPEKQPALKRRRTTNEPVQKKKSKHERPPKKRRGYKGALEEIWALPLDVTYEASFVPCTVYLLHLARTNKELRRILMARSSLSLWIRSRSTVPALPDCPFDLSEPQYASLLFEPFCRYCSANNVQTVIWEARMRCCKRCGPLMFQYWVNIKGVPDILQTIIPSTHEFTTGTIHPHTEKKYSLEIAADMTDEMEKLTEEEKPMWFWNKKKEFDKRAEHAVACLLWVRTQHVVRGFELTETRLRRTVKIIEKLAHLGWGSEMGKMSSDLLTEHKHVKVAKPLTERAWAKIEGEMIAFMEEVRAQRLVKERNKVLKARCTIMEGIYAKFQEAQPLHSIHPGVADFATIPKLKAALENPDIEAPIDPEEFRISDEELLEFSRQWREEKDKELVEILRHSSIGADASKDMLKLATTWFNCKSCNAPISYPRILVHTCNTRSPGIIPDPCTIFERLKSAPWNLGGDRISFHEAAHNRAKDVLKALKLGPETTFEQMKAMNPFLECVCSFCYRQSTNGPNMVRSFTRWDHMIHHTPRYNVARVYKPYHPVSANRAAILETAERKELLKIRREHDWSDYSYRSYCCMHCKVRDTRTNIEQHLRSKHTIPQAIFDTDYTYHLDARVNLRAPFIPLPAKPSSKAPKILTIPGAAPVAIVVDPNPGPSTPTDLSPPSIAPENASDNPLTGASPSLAPPGDTTPLAAGDVDDDASPSLPRSLDDTPVTDVSAATPISPP